MKNSHHILYEKPEKKPFPRKTNWVISSYVKFTACQRINKTTPPASQHRLFSSFYDIFIEANNLLNFYPKAELRQSLLQMPCLQLLLQHCQFDQFLLSMNTTEKKVISCLRSRRCSRNVLVTIIIRNSPDSYLQATAIKSFFLSLSKVIGSRIKLLRTSLTRHAGERRRAFLRAKSRLNWIKVPTIHSEMQQRVSANLARFSFLIFCSKAGIAKTYC